MKWVVNFGTLHFSSVKYSFCITSFCRMYHVCKIQPIFHEMISLLFSKKLAQDLKPVYFAVYPNRKNTKHSKVRYKYSVAASIILSRNQVVSQILVTLLQMSSFLNFEQDKKIYHCVTGIVSAIEILSCLLALTISRVGEFP